ncbi:unnamed protein product [Sphagnum tenellum]
MVGGTHNKSGRVQLPPIERKEAGQRSLREDLLQKNPTRGGLAAKRPGGQRGERNISDSQCKLAEIFQATVERNRHLPSSTWLRYGDTCSKNFFDFHRVEKKKTLFRELVSETGSITAQKDLSQFVTDFYTNLYALDAHLLGTEEAQVDAGQVSRRKYRRTRMKA